MSTLTLASNSYQENIDIVLPEAGVISGVAKTSTGGAVAALCLRDRNAAQQLRAYAEKAVRGPT